MKRATYLLLSISFLSLCHCGQETKETRLTETNRQKLHEAISAFNKAFQAGDVQTPSSMITDSYVHTNGTSQSIPKTTWLNYLKKRSERIAQGELEVLHYEMGDMEFVYYPDFAIVTGRVLAKNRMGQDTVENQYRVTHVWVMEDGKWKRAGFHDGKIQ